MRFKSALAVTGALALVLVGATPAWAAIVTWDDEAANDNFTSDTNWVGDVVPVGGDDFVFPVGSGAVQDIAANLPMNSLTLSSPGFQLTGAEIALAAGGMSVTQSAVITSDVSATATQVWNVAAAAQLELDGVTDVTGFLQVNGAGVTVFGEVDGTGIIEALQDSVVILDGGGTVQGVEVHGSGVVNSSSPTPDTGVNLSGGTLSGGEIGNFGAQQLIGGIAANGGTLSPGPDVLGTQVGWMQVNGNVNGSDASNYRVDTVGTDSDRVSVNGVFNAQDMRLSIVSDLAAPVGTEFVIVDAQGGPTPDSWFTDALTGDQLLDGAVFGGGPGFFRIDYNTNEIVLTYLGATDPNAPVLPPTGTDLTAPLTGMGLLVIAGLALLFVARRRTAE